MDFCNFRLLIAGVSGVGETWVLGCNMNLIGKMMEEDEINSAEKFKKYLQKYNKNVEYKKGNDPPDFIFKINNLHFAVEHTRLYSYKNGNGEGYPQEEYIKKKQKEYENSINSKIKNKLNSIYCIFINFSIKDSEWENFEDRIISRLKNNKKIDKLTFFSGKIYISKLDDVDNNKNFYCLPTPNHKVPKSNKLSCNIQAQIDFALGERVRQKDKKFKNIDNCDKNILLIQSKFTFATQDNIIKGINEYRDKINNIDEIYIIIKNDKVCNIYSK